jgi:hypothetical protein
MCARQSSERMERAILFGGELATLGAERKKPSAESKKWRENVKYNEKLALRNDPCSRCQNYLLL